MGALDLPVAVNAGALVENVHLALRDAIVAGEIAPGARLREVELASHYGTSSTPVREALRRLAFDGLVELLPRRGAVVAAPDVAEIKDLYVTRAILECSAAEMAAASPVRDLTRVEAVLDHEATILGELDQRAFNASDIVFHRALSDLAQNAVLAREAERLHRQIQAVRARAAVHLPHQPARSHEQHLAIVQAVRDGDQAAARRLVEEHIRTVRDAVLEVLGTAAQR